MPPKSMGVDGEETGLKHWEFGQMWTRSGGILSEDEQRSRNAGKNIKKINRDFLTNYKEAKRGKQLARMRENKNL